MPWAIQAGIELTLALANAYNADLARLSREFDFDSRQHADQHSRPSKETRAWLKTVF